MRSSFVRAIVAFQVCALSLAVHSADSTSIAVTYRIRDDQIYWFGVSGNRLIFVWGSGNIHIYDGEKAQYISGVKINDLFNNQRLNGADLFLLPSPLFRIANWQSSKMKIFDINGKAKICEFNCNYPYGFSKDGNSLFFDTGYEAYIFDYISGTKLWYYYYGYDGKILSGSQHGEIHALDFENDLVIVNNLDDYYAVDMEGKILWKKSFRVYGNRVPSLYQSRGSSCVVGLRNGEFFTINTRNGETIWRGLKAKYEDHLVATGLSGKKQAYYFNNRLLLLDAFTSQALDIQKINYDIDATFSSDE
ncbi:MAG: hypothetical protein NTX50_21620, partial [Candidatus Sumerlaeota bacterium]|nr:hypothetical protein [Candidatus Sumerlaeota bacterium]